MRRMITSSIFAVASLLALSALGYLPHEGLGASETLQVPEIDPRDSVIQRLGPDWAKETITGESAKQYLRYRQSLPHLRAAYARAKRDLAARGHDVASGRVFAIRTIRLGGEGAEGVHDSGVRIRRAAWSVQDGSVTLLFNDTSDGSSGTYGGTLEAERTGVRMELWQGETNLASSDWSTNWSELLGGYSCDGGSCGPFQNVGGTERGRQGLVRAGWQGALGSPFARPSPLTRVQFQQDPGLGGWRGFYGCSAAFCGGAAVSCALVNIALPGGGHAACFVTGCTGAMIGCTWGNFWR